MHRNYYVTFGQRYREEPHPTHSSAHPDSYAMISAPTMEVARAEAFNQFGSAWAFIYSEDDFTPREYPRGAMLKVKVGE